MTMEGDNSRDNGNSGVPSPAPNVVPAASAANAVNPYNIMAYHPSVFSSKPGQPPPQFYTNGVTPAYGGIYVGPQPAMMYAPPFYTGMMPFPGPPFPGQPMVQEPVEKKTEEKKPQAGERAGSPDSSDSDDSQLSKERGAAKRSKASKGSHPTGPHRQGEGSAAPSRLSTGPDGTNDDEAGAGGANASEAWRQRNSSLGGPSGEQNQASLAPLHPGQDDREQKRQRRKQSNRESARRSRLRKQAECEQLSEKVTLLEAENAALKEENRLLREHLARMGDHSLPGQVQAPAELRQDGAGEGKPLETTAPPVHSAPSAAPSLPITSLPAPLLPTLSRDMNPIPGVGVLSLDGSPDMPVRPAQDPPATGAQG